MREFLRTSSRGGLALAFGVLFGGCATMSLDREPPPIVGQLGAPALPATSAGEVAQEGAGGDIATSDAARSEQIERLRSRYALPPLSLRFTAPAAAVPALATALAGVRIPVDPMARLSGDGPTPAQRRIRMLQDVRSARWQGLDLDLRSRAFTRSPIMR